MTAPANPSAMRSKKYRFRRTTAQNAIASHRKTHLRASFAAALQRQSAIAMAAGNRRNNICRVSLRHMDDHPLRGDPRENRPRGRCHHRYFDMEAEHVFCLVKHGGLLSTLRRWYTPMCCCPQGWDKVHNSSKLSARWVLLVNGTR